MSIQPNSVDFDPEILSVYSCVRDLYRMCDDYIVSSGYIQWVFDPANPSMVRLQQVIKSFQFHEVNFFYHTDPLMFGGGSAIFIEAHMSHLWGKMFDCVRTDRVREALSPSRRPEKAVPVQVQKLFPSAVVIFSYVS